MSVFFPQLRPGTALQYPLRKALSYRTVVHPAQEISPLRSADDSAARVDWALQLRGLSDAELADVRLLFTSMRGAHGSFVFLDPEGNLLARSEDLQHATWQRSASMQIAAEAPPPQVASKAFSLQAQAGAAAELWQPLSLPTGYHWLLSVYARAASPSSMALFLRSAYGEHTAPFALGPSWQRFWITGHGWPAGSGIDAGLRLPAGSHAEVSAFQLETQTAPSAYKRTLQQSGAFAGARFLDDTLRVTTLAPNCHQTNLRITAPLVG